MHGFSGCGEDFAEFSPLCGSSHAWICPNLPGHGPAPTLACSPEATAQQVHTHATALYPAATKLLLGYSMGARAALLHALANPAHWDALILISANPGIEDETVRAERARSDATLAQRIRREGLPAFLEYWQHTPMIRSQQGIRADWQRAMQRNRLKHSAEGLARSLEQFSQAQCPNLWPQLKQLSCPVLLITGANDSKYCAIAKRMKASLAHAQHLRIDGAGHMPHLEAPEATAATIQAFVRPLLKTR